MIKSKDIWYILITWFIYLAYFTVTSSCVSTNNIKPERIHKEFNN